MSEVAEQWSSKSEMVEAAIQCSLESRWEDALEVNNAIIERYGKEEDTLNRLGKVYLELGNLEESKRHYEMTLELNPMNQIAHKSVYKLEQIHEEGITLERRAHAVSVELFAEEPGKSGLVNVVIAGSLHSKNLLPGDEVDLVSEGERLIVNASSSGSHLGDVDPRIGHRLAELMKTGNRYTAAVARVHRDRLDIMVREVFQAPENATTPSFPSSKASRHEDFRSYGREILFTERTAPVAATSGEDAFVPEPDIDDIEAVEEGVERPEGEEPVVVVDEEEDDTDDDVRPEDEL